MTTDEQGYVPTTEAVRQQYARADLGPGSMTADADLDLEEFDRWLAAHDAEQQRIGAVRALQEFASSVVDEVREQYPHMEAEREAAEYVEGLARARADRIEKGEG